MAVTSQSILVLWNPPPSSEQNGILIGYKILYRVVRDDEGTVHVLWIVLYLYLYLYVYGSSYYIVLVLTNKVALRRARLLLGWVTVCGQVNHFDL